MRKLIFLALICFVSATTASAQQSADFSALTVKGSPVLTTLNNPLLPAPSPPTPQLCPWARPAITGTTYYVDNNKVGYNGRSAPTGACATADAAAGTSPAAAWCTIARVKTKMPTLAAGDAVLFKGGDIWTEDFGLISVHGTPSSKIIFSSYGTGQPILDEAGNPYGFDACNSGSCDLNGGTGNGSNYNFIIDNWEVRHAGLQAMTFETSGGTPSNAGAGTPDSTYNVTVQNSYIHNSGPGAPSLGSGEGTSQTYNNQLDFESFSQATDNTHFYCNTVQDVGGWNAIEVHFDTGAVDVEGNIAGTNGHACGPHGCIDLKGPGSPFAPAKIISNTASCGLAKGNCITGLPGFFVDNEGPVGSPSASIIYQNNLSYDNGLNYQICAGDNACSSGTCPLTVKFYNNTGYFTGVGGALYNGYFADQCGFANSVPLTLDIRNNIFDGGPESVSQANGGSSCIANYNNQGGSLGAGTKTGCLLTAEANGQVNVNPLYQNVSLANFLLQATSPDLSVGLAGLTVGNSNIGAFGTGVNASVVTTLVNGGSGLAQTASQQVTTAGTAIATGATQAQTGVTITGLTTTSSCLPSVPTALPITWQTGIAMSIVVTTNTATLELTNPTAASITPIAQAVNIKCIL